MGRLLVGVLGALLWMTAAHAADDRDCVGPYSFAATGNVPADAGVVVSAVDGLMTAEVDVTAGTVAATLERSVGTTWVAVGSYTGDGALDFTGPKDKLRLNVGTCTGCTGTFRVCGRK